MLLYMPICVRMCMDRSGDNSWELVLPTMLIWRLEFRLSGKLLDPLPHLTDLKINIEPMFAVC